MSDYKVVRFGDVVEIASGQVDPRVPPYRDMIHVGGDNIEGGTGRLHGLQPASEVGLVSGKYEFRRGDVLYSKIRPALNKVAVPDFDGICSADIYPLRPNPSRVHSAYLVYALRQPSFLDYAATHSTRTNIPKINRDALTAYPLALPPLPEQRRIAAILDEADALRRKRREALGLLDELLRSAFLEMFGDPVTNPRGWPVEPMSRLASDGFRNGLSPSSRGTVQGRVLTLSAVTGGRFDPEQSKNAVFDREPDESQLAMDGTFLICRGNGNLDLVGRAQVAAGAPTGTAFPDTVIACRADPNRVVNSYLLAVWSTRAVRSQIESGARTTNGTHKVNQNLLGSVVIPVPPMDLQRRFAEVAERLAEAHAASSRARSGAERLFESLLYRTFTLGAEAADAS